jgi:type III pantothenate kinase
MIARSEESSTERELPQGRLVVLDIGNTKTSAGLWLNGAVTAVQSCPTGDEEAFRQIWPAVLDAYGLEQDWPTVAIASVVPEATELVSGVMALISDIRPVVIGDTIACPLELDVEEVDRVGVDRVCAAAAAYERYQQACVVANVGTAVTVDVVSDDGKFLGGAILPGMALQAHALGESTAQLPTVLFERPESPIGRSTEQAICSGLYFGLIGAVRGLIEQYAEFLGRWPDAVATGGGAEILRDADFVDAVIPNMCLVGVGLAWQKHRSNDDDL